MVTPCTYYPRVILKLASFEAYTASVCTLDVRTTYNYVVQTVLSLSVDGVAAVRNINYKSIILRFINIVETGFDIWTCYIDYFVGKFTDINLASLQLNFYLRVAMVSSQIT